MTTEQMDWLDDERAGRHKPQFTPPEASISRDLLVSSPSVSALVEKVQRAMVNEDRRMRAEVLPAPPEGWVWVSEFVYEDNLAEHELKVRTRYHLRMESDQW